MKRPFSLESTDSAFFQAAPVRIVQSVDSTADAETLWQTLTADKSLATWAPGLTRSDWTSPRPFGVGSTRIVEAAGGLASLDEKFFRWEEGSRMSFHITAASLPGFKKFAEDLVVEPIPEGSRLTWTFAVEGKAWFAPLLTLARPILERASKQWAQGAVDHAAQAVAK